MTQTKVFKNIGELVTLAGVVKKQGRQVQAKDLRVLKDAAFVVQKSRIIWLGKETALPSAYKKDKFVDLKKQNVFPGFVDCHTHLIFAGDRQDEFEKRNQGQSYQEIAAAGGGILKTMRQTRKATLEELLELGQARLQRHLQQGVTTVEIKSGYGLNTKTEEKILKAAKSLKKANIVTTFLGAHAIPKEFTCEEAYLDKLKGDLKRIKDKQLSERVDIFVEKSYFSVAKARDFLKYAQAMGFAVTIHADQLSRTGATGLAVELAAQSADHVIKINSKDLKALAASQTVAVLLPAADFYLQCDYPPARKLIDAGATVALATDYNPGSSPTQNISFVGLLGRLQMKMTLPEVWAALTFNGAKALGMDTQVGALLPGYQADFFVSPQKWQDFFYDLSAPEIGASFVKGRKIYAKK